MTPPGTTAPLRQALPVDRGTVVALISEYYTFDEIAFDEGEVTEGLTHLLTEPALGRAYLIEHEGQVAGYLILTFGFDLEFGGRQATVTDVYLRPDFRGQGLGRAAFAVLEELCAAEGVGALELQVERDNVEAQAFYRSLGFEGHDRLPMSKRVKASRG